MSRRQGLNAELLVQDAFYLLHLTFFAQVHDGDRDTRLAGTSRTSASVGIAFHIIGQAIVDDVGQVVHVQSAGSHIRSNQQLQMTLAELLHHQVTLRLAQFTVQRVGVIAVLYQLVGNLLRFQPSTAEDNAVNHRIEVY